MMAVTRMSTAREVKKTSKRWSRQRPSKLGGSDHPAVPTLTTLTPSTAVHGGANLTLTCTGTGFTTNSNIYFNGGLEPTTYVSATSLTTLVKPSLVSQAIAVPVHVRNGAERTVNRTFTFT
jgi:IPT/TIG domain